MQLFVQQGLAMALVRHCPGENLMAHSDRSVQYASEYYQRLLKGHGVTGSMSRKANCWDNGAAEPWRGSRPKGGSPPRPKGIVLRHPAERARHSLFESIEVFYSRVCRHSALGYQSPTQFPKAA